MYNRTLTLSLALSLLVAGCSDLREPVTKDPVDPETLVTSALCESCHGSAANAAPPTAAFDPSYASDYHQNHVVASALHEAILCSTCHPMPTSVSDPSVPQHVNGKADVEFKGIAQRREGAPEPMFDAATKSCSNVYCHAPQASGATTAALSWLDTGAGPLGCDGCHGTPPTAGHPVSNDCVKCHATVVDTDNKTIISAKLHVNGTADVSVQSCTSCHASPPAAPHPARSDCATCHAAVVNADGSVKDWTLHDNGHVDVGNLSCNVCHGAASGDPAIAASWAPPTDTQGRSDATLPSVGAHQAHVAGTTLAGVVGAWHRTIQCRDCHVTPTTSSSPRHIDGNVDIAFGFAASNSASPAYDSTTHTCSGVHCHGAGGVAGAVGDTVTWTAPGALTCGTSCHSLPPGGIHPDRTDCEACHKEWDGTKFVKPEQHINGTVDYL